MADPIIRLAGVRKSYGSGRARQEVLRGVALDIEKGELVALVGQSGSGKSTLLNIIGGLDRPDEGVVSVDGQDTARLDDTALSHLRNERFGFIFQAFHLLDHLTCAENVALPALFGAKHAHGTRARAVEVLSRVGLDLVADRRPGELSAARSNASPSPGRCSTAPPSCSATSRPATSTARPAATSSGSSRS